MQLTEDQIRRIARQEGKKIVNGGGGMVIGGGSGASGSSETAREAQHAKEADHATSADKAKEADHATKAAGLDDAAQTALDNKYLRKDQDDETEHKLTMGEAEVKGDAAVKGDLKIGMDGSYTITKDGIAKLAGVVAEYLHSEHFTPGTAMGFDGTGYGITKDEHNRYTLELDNLIVRMKMIIAELEVHEMSFIGGTVVLSPCGNRVDRVEKLDAEGSPITTDGTAVDRYRCYFLASDGDRQIKNEWAVGQLARCKTNNITAPGNYTNYQNSDYWRLVVGVSSEPVTIDGKAYHYFDLSNNTASRTTLTVTEGGESKTYTVNFPGVDPTLNSVPMAGDNVVGLGHAWDDSRKNAAMLSADENIGWTLYKGINTYSLGEEFVVNKFSIKETVVTTDHFILRPYAAPTETQTVTVMRGAYDNGKSYGHNDLVTYNGQVWVCTVKVGDKVKGKAPSLTGDGAKYWSVYATKGADGKDGKDGTAATVYTIEPCANFEATGKLTDASHVTVSISGDVRVYKTIGDQKTLCGSGDGVYAEYFRLSIGGTNYDGKNTFTYNGGNIKVSKNIPYEVGKDKNNVPGSATITLYDFISGGTVGNQLASLVVPVSLNPGAIVDVNSELGTISLKVQSLQSMAKSKNLISGGNVVGLYNKQYEVLRSSAFKMEQGKTYTVTARLWLESASNGHSVIAFVFGADRNWTYAYSSDQYGNTSGSVVRFKFTAGTTKQMVVGIYEQNSSGNDPGSGNYNGVHVDWLRVDEGDWTGTGDNGRTIDAWTPSEEEIDAVNLLPDPDFSEAIGYSDGMGERNTFRSNMGDYVSWMSRDSSTDGAGCHGVTFERSGYSTPGGSNPDTYAGIRYIVPFRGAGTYCISFAYTDLSQTLGGASMDETISMELHPCYADKNRITYGISTGGRNTSSANSGIIRAQNYKTFGETATDSSGNVKKIAYLEVRVFLRGNGSVRVSRLCLSKSDHFIYWNANEVSEARKKDAAQLATGIDIYSHKIIATTDNFTVRNNSGVTTFSIDEKGNIVGTGNAYFKGTITGSAINGGTINGTTINGSTINSTDGTSTTKIAGGQITTNNINANGGNISFFNFDNAGMYSGSIGQDGKMYSGLGMSMNNLSVSGNSNRRISSVFLGNGAIDSRFTNSNNRTVYRVGSTTLGNTFYNYIKLERIGSGSSSFENDPTHAALGIETQGDFCLTALGGPSQFAGMCLASNSGGTGDKKHCFYLCSGGTFTMPSDPPGGMLFIVIQTGSRITFNGNGHQFRSGTNYSSTCNSNIVGQWTMFYFDGSYWNTVYINGRPW